MENEKNTKKTSSLKIFGTIPKIALIFFIGFSLYLFASTIMMIFLTKSSKEVKTPDVVGSTFNDVYNSLIRKGIKPEINFVDVYDMEDGIILNQYPESGKIIPQDSRLSVTVSRSRLLLDVPNLVGTELPVARGKLNKMHHYDRTISIDTGVISYIPSEKVPENIVIGQSPKPGEKITPSQKVNLLVSSGPSADKNIIPQVAGQSISLCYDLLRSKELNVTQQINIVHNKDLSGIVTAQTPAAGTRITPGMTIRLTVNYYPMTDKPYHAYERINYEIPRKDGPGKYEIMVEDHASKRIVFTGEPNNARRLDCVYHRTGNAQITILKDKKVIQKFKAEVNFK